MLLETTWIEIWSRLKWETMGKCVKYYSSAHVVKIVDDMLLISVINYSNKNFDALQWAKIKLNFCYQNLDKPPK